MAFTKYGRVKVFRAPGRRCDDDYDGCPPAPSPWWDVACAVIMGATPVLMGLAIAKLFPEVCEGGEPPNEEE